MSGIEDAFADGIRLRWMSDIQNVTTPQFGSVAEWLETGGYRWLPSVTSGTALIDLRGSADSLTQAMAAEISRFSCAAYESLLDSTPPAHATRSLGWSLVRHYYAAFYCSHALFRIMGESLTFLSASTVSKLNKVAGQYLGVSPGISAGLHHIRRSPNNSNILMLEHISSGGGSHEDMWTRLLALLVELENLITKSQGTLPAALRAVSTSTALRAQLCYGGKNNGAWLSAIRNAVNYRHDYGVWYPYTLHHRVSVSLVQRMGKWKPTAVSGFSINSDKGELGQLIDTCNVLARILLIALKDIAYRSPKASKSFADLYPLKFLRQRKVAL